MSQATLVTRIGVGLDTARYGHYVSFLREDLQPAAKPFAFLESHDGYQQLEEALRRIAKRHDGAVVFHIRIDAAGQYALNLQTFLRRLELNTSVSVGEPKRNRDYKNVHFPKRKADAVDSLACSRFAIVERPDPTPEVPLPFAQLRDVATALTAASKQTTRQINRLHNHLARVFPELATIAINLGAKWVLTLLAKYPTPQRIAAARRQSLEKIAYVTPERARRVHELARSSVGSLQGAFAEQMVRELVDAVRECQRREERFSELLEKAFDDLPEGPHRQILSIPGIGKRTAAALVAKIVTIDRFDAPENLVAYFGIFPEENSSGIDRNGKPRDTRNTRMSRKGNDLVRGLLWMAAQSAIKCNPAVRALYARQKAAGKRGDVALGHCMRKLLDLVFALWKTDRPFDPNHHPWEADKRQTDLAKKPTTETAQPATPAPDVKPDNGAEGRKGQSPNRRAVTADATALATRTLTQPEAPTKQSRPTANSETETANSTATANRQRSIDFAQLRRQLTMTDVLQRLGLLQQLRGRASQKRGPCPIHQPNQADGRVFSVNLEKNLFRCLDPQCAAQGNVLDFWAALQRLPLRDAALDLAATFHLDHKPEIKP